MMFRNATRVLVVLAATAAVAQSAQPGTTPAAPILNPQGMNLQGMAERRATTKNKSADPQGLVMMREEVAEMGSTVAQMRVVLNQMQAKAARNKDTSSLTKTNLDMWGVMVGQMEKELQDLQLALAAREDLELRRADLYRQADAKAAKAAEAYRAAQAARFAEAQKNPNGTPTPTDQSASPAAQTAPAQPSAGSPANTTASPN